MTTKIPTQQDLIEEINFLQTLSDTDFFDDINFEELAYQGFDPITLLAYLRQRAVSGNVTPDEHKINLTWLAALGTIRGTNLNKIKAKSSPAGIQKLEKMIAIYKLTNKPKAAQDASLGRIAACFAKQISYSAHVKKILKSPVSATELHKDYPIGLAISTAGSLITS